MNNPAVLTKFPLPTAAINVSQVSHHASSGFVAFFAGFSLLILVLIIVYLVLWILALVDLLQRDFDSSSDKIVWLILILLVPFLGTILYYPLVKNKKAPKKKGKK